jgi:hypothetical protein
VKGFTPGGNVVVVVAAIVVVVVEVLVVEEVVVDVSLAGPEAETGSDVRATRIEPPRTRDVIRRISKTGPEH